MNADTAPAVASEAHEIDQARLAREVEARRLRAVIAERKEALAAQRAQLLRDWLEETATEHGLLAQDEAAYAALRGEIDHDAVALSAKLGYGVRLGDVQVQKRATLRVLDHDEAVRSLAGYTTRAGKPLVKMTLDERAVLAWLKENPDRLALDPAAPEGSDDLLDEISVRRDWVYVPALLSAEKPESRTED